MNIKVKGFLNFKHENGDQAIHEMKDNRTTIRDLFDALSKKYGKNFEDLVFDPKTKKVKSYHLIFLNGRNYRDLPHGLDNVLKEGDEVALYPQIAGG